MPRTPSPGPALVLASGSPRRRMLLQAVGVPIAAIRPPDVDEDPVSGEDPENYVRRLAQDKARAVDAPGAWILAADTTVHQGGRVFGKPLDPGDAVTMLQALSGREHEVSTGWCLRWGGPGAPPASPQEHLGHVTSRVRFRALSAAEVRAYVATGEGRDKAGGYGIQGLGAALVEAVEGSHSNVVGLPLVPVLAALRAVGIHPEAPAPETP